MNPVLQIFLVLLLGVQWFWTVIYASDSNWAKVAWSIITLCGMWIITLKTKSTNKGTDKEREA